MIHQYDVWVYLHNKKKRTDMVAKKFGVTTDQANHLLQKMVFYGHATKEKNGPYSYWKAVEVRPPRRNAYESDIKRQREMDVLTQMMFEGVIYRAKICEKTGLTEWMVQECLHSLLKQGEVERVGRKGWRVVM